MKKIFVLSKVLAIFRSAPMAVAAFRMPSRLSEVWRRMPQFLMAMLWNETGFLSQRSLLTSG